MYEQYSAEQKTLIANFQDAAISSKSLIEFYKGLEEKNKLFIFQFVDQYNKNVFHYLCAVENFDAVDMYINNEDNFLNRIIDDPKLLDNINSKYNDEEDTPLLLACKLLGRVEDEGQKYLGQDIIGQLFFAHKQVDLFERNKEGESPLSILLTDRTEQGISWVGCLINMPDIWDRELRDIVLAHKIRPEEASKTDAEWAEALNLPMLVDMKYNVALNGHLKLVTEIVEKVTSEFKAFKTHKECAYFLEKLSFDQKKMLFYHTDDDDINFLHTAILRGDSSFASIVCTKFFVGFIRSPQSDATPEKLASIINMQEESMGSTPLAMVCDKLAALAEALPAAIEKRERLRCILEKIEVSNSTDGAKEIVREAMARNMPTLTSNEVNTWQILLDIFCCYGGDVCLKDKGGYQSFRHITRQ